MTLPSASKLELTDTCEGSAVYPGVDSTDFWADLGTAKHAFLARALEVGRETALAEVPEKHRAACASLDLEQLPAGQPGAWVAEVAFALDVETGAARELGRGIDRQYAAAGLRPTEIPGSIDLLALSVDGDAVIVTDYKTGWARVTTAQENLQLLFAAVCASLVYGKLAARGAILYPGPDGDQPYFDVGTWDAFDLDAAKQRLMELGRKVLALRAAAEGDPTTGEVVTPRLVVGKHCRYCPAIASCPAQGKFVRRLLHAPEDTLADLKGMLNPHTARLVYDRLKAVKYVIERAETALYAYAAFNPVALSDGTVLGETETQREYLDPAAVTSTLTTMFGEDVARDALESKATKASVKRALGKHGGAVGKRMKRVLSALRDTGGVRVKTIRTVREFKPGAPTLDEGDEAP